jgi:hypothetical protein
MNGKLFLILSVFGFSLLVCSCAAGKHIEGFETEAIETRDYQNETTARNYSVTQIPITQQASIENYVSSMEENEAAVFSIDEETQKKLTYDFEHKLFSLVAVKEKYGVVPEQWATVVDDSGILQSPFHSFYRVNELTIIQYYDGWDKELGDEWQWYGSHTAPTFYLVLDAKTFTYIYPTTPAQEPWFFVANDIIYIFERTKNSSYEYVSLTSYKKDTGDMVEQYYGKYNWSDINLYLKNGVSDLESLVEINSTISNVNCVAELQEYMLSISDTWYT